MRFILALIFLSLAAHGERYNIVLFVTDDQSPIAGCYGSKDIQTPHLDALAAGGTTFTEAFATTASCSASRSVILTGLHNHFNGQYGHTHHYHKFAAFPSMAAVSLPRQLAQAGYRTAQIGKFHVAPESVFRFHHYLRAPARNPVQMAEACRPLLEDASESPFFLYFATSDPHRGGGTDMASPLDLKPDLFGNKPGRKAWPGVTEVFYNPDEITVPPYLPDTPECRAELAQMYQSCSRIDQGLGHLMDLLKQTGHWEKTVLIFTADHGIAFPGAKTTVYEAGLRVPFVVRHPSPSKRGITNNALISHVDITPTLLDIAGAYDPARRAPRKPVAVDRTAHGENSGPIPQHYHGRSWLPILGEETPTGWDTIAASHTFHEIQMYYPMRVIRDRKFKLIWNIAHRQPYPFASDLWAAATWQAQHRKGPDAPYGMRSVHEYIHRPEFEFFAIDKDPHESTNLTGDPNYAGQLEEYKSRLKAMQEKTGDPWIMKWRYE